MRLTRYINEAVRATEEEVYDTIFNNVLPSYLHALRRAGSFIFRGSNHRPNRGIGEGWVRDDRKPFSTTPEEHAVLDKMFKKKFGWNVRSNSAFATGHQSHADVYGYVYMFFPKGKYKFVYSTKVEDLWGRLGIDRKDEYMKWLEKNKKSHNPESSKEWVDIWLKGGMMEKVMQPIIDTYTDKNLATAIEKGVEIAFNCKSYYIVDFEYIDALSERLRV